MARRSAPPSGADVDERRVDVRGWLGGNRLSGFTVIMLALVVLAAFVLVPTASTYVQQRQRIAALEESVVVGQDKIDDLERERDRWNDSAYITTQARERLYYVNPGDVTYLVIDDLDADEEAAEQTPVSPDVEESDGTWTDVLLSSIVGAGLAKTATSGDEDSSDGTGTDDSATTDDGSVFQPDSSGDQ